MIEINVIDRANVIYLFVFSFLISGKNNPMKLSNFWLHVIEISDMGSQYDSHTTRNKQKKKQKQKIAQIKVRMKNYVLKWKAETNRKRKRFFPNDEKKIMDLDVKKTMTLSSKFVSRKICEHLSSIEKQIIAVYTTQQFYGKLSSWKSNQIPRKKKKI